MGVLNNVEIGRMINRGEILGANPELMSPASIDFRLSAHLFALPKNVVIDTKHIEDLDWEEHLIDQESGFALQPGKLYLGSTIEELNLPSNIASRADGKSTIGRLGLIVHITAGWIDPGFKGSVTLEMVATNEILIYPGLRIGQFTFHSVRGEGNAKYAGRYQDRQKGVPLRPRSGGLFTK